MPKQSTSSKTCKGPAEDYYIEVDNLFKIYDDVRAVDGITLQLNRGETYAKKGETLLCAGCHENRWSAPKTPASVPLALRRVPSAIVAGGTDLPTRWPS